MIDWNGVRLHSGMPSDFKSEYLAGLHRNLHTAHGSDNAHAVGRAWKRPLLIAACIAAVAALIALHIGAAVSLFRVDFGELAHPLSSASVALILLLLALKVGLLGGLHRIVRTRIGRVFDR